MNTNLIARVPEVLGVVITDQSGALLDAHGNIDGESAGAVYAFSAQSLGQAGETLGLGRLEKLTMTSAGAAAIVMMLADSIVACHVDPSKPLSAIEKKLEDTIRSQR